MAMSRSMDLETFSKLGFIQEINRRILHPCGLTMVVEPNPEVGDMIEILDCRDVPEGLWYEPEKLSQVKAQSVVELFNARFKFRREAFGHIIQPVPERELTE